MAVYHIVLFKLKPGVSAAQLEQLHKAAKSMVGKIPGLQRLDIGDPLPISAPRAKGYNCGVVAILDKPETVPIYAKHPAHLEVHNFREELCEDTLAFDLEYEQ